MKPFDIVTEADARVLEYGSTITLSAGGHITPLALDTLRQRRVTVVRGGAELDASTLAPVGRIERVAVAGDHTSLSLKTAVLAHLRARGVAAEDLGTHTNEPVDYPDTAAAAARAVARGEAHAAVAIDGSGIGSAVAANKIHGVRAAMCPSPMLARYGREHNGINVLTLGANTMKREDALAILDAFLDTPMREPRYIRRLSIIRGLETGERSR
ncbi:MAG TPA: RpiB/LacA/LacB family sugar-phosphate isomerase [Vicinamibacterales bacterium]|nr:RpiB/LacA/LacB family sugar-phosphate isomerase [Vicinamibacterales bacterium]